MQTGGSKAGQADNEQDLNRLLRRPVKSLLRKTDKKGL
jgi:hypothetical protein